MILSGEKIRLMISKGESDAVKYAVEDLCKDIFNVIGAETEYGKNFDIFVGNLSNPVARDFLDNAEIYYGDIFAKKEAHKVMVEHDKCFVLGSDILGTVFAVYEFCSSSLGVSPTAFWSGDEVVKKDGITVKEIVVQAFAYEYRCFAINDEDCLNVLGSSAKQRFAYNDKFTTVTSPKFIIAACKTALRLKYNLVVPATMLNIFNPHEEAIVKCVTSLGLFITQNFYEPLGVSLNTWNYYWKSKDRAGLKASYNENKEYFVEIWHDYVKKWAKYPNIIWQLGMLNTQYSQRVFFDERKIVDDNAKYEIICDALSAQCSAVYDIVGHNDTKFMLFDSAYIRHVLRDKSFELSPNTILLKKHLYKNDKKRKISRSFLSEGVAFLGTNAKGGAHNIQIPDFSMIAKLSDEYKKGTTVCSYLSVGNIREVLFNATVMATLSQDITKETEVVGAFCQNFYAQNDIKDAYKSFYDCYSEVDFLLADMSIYNAALKILDELPNAKDKVLFHDGFEKTSYVKRDKVIAKLEKSIVGFLQLAIDLKFKYKPQKNVEYYEYSLTHQVYALAKLYSYFANLLRYCDSKQSKFAHLALEDIQAVKNFLEKMAYGQWDGAYKKNLFSFQLLITKTKELCTDRIKGEL